MSRLYRMWMVFLGGGLGATLRYLIGLWIPPAWAAPLPLATLLINLAGAAGLGIVFVLADEAGMMTARARLAIAVGFLGGFTTWSTFMAGTVTLLHGGAGLAATLYLLLSLAGGPLAILGASRAMHALLGAGAHLRYLSIAAEMSSIEAEDREPAERR